MGVCHYSNFQYCRYFLCPWMSFVTTDDLSVMITKITSRIGVSWTHSLPFWFWPILILKWSYYQKKVNQITSNHTTLWNSALPILEVFGWISLDVNPSLNQTPWHTCSIWDKLGWLDWFWQFLCVWLTSFNPQGFCYSYSCSLCKGRTFFCMGFIPRKLWILIFVFDWLYFIVLLFILYRSPSLSI